MGAMWARCSPGWFGSGQSSVQRERCVSGRLSTSWIEHHAGESGKSLNRQNRIPHDHGSSPVTILQALVGEPRRRRVTEIGRFAVLKVQCGLFTELKLGTHYVQLLARMPQPVLMALFENGHQVLKGRQTRQNGVNSSLLGVPLRWRGHDEPGGTDASVRLPTIVLHPIRFLIAAH